MGRINLKYITSRLVSRKSTSAFRKRAKMAMDANGYVIIVEEGWLIKKYSDGSIERLEELDIDNQNQSLILD